MFDPFEDFQTAGYLRNVEGLKDLEKLKVLEGEPVDDDLAKP